MMRDISEQDLAQAYAEMAQDEERKNQAHEWCEGVIDNVANQ